MKDNIILPLSSFKFMVGRPLCGVIYITLMAIPTSNLVSTISLMFSDILMVICSLYN